MKKHQKGSINMANGIEEAIINDMQQLDRRDLPLLSQEEMNRRGLFYDESSGTYKRRGQGNLSVSIPGQPQKTFAEDPAQYIRVSEDELSGQSVDPYTETVIGVGENIPTDIYTRGPGYSRYRDPDEPFYPYVRGGDNITPLASRFDTQADYDESSINLDNYRNLANYLDQMIQMPETIGKGGYYVDDQGNLQESYTNLVGDEVNYARDRGVDMATDAKQKAINQMLGIHLKGKIGKVLPYPIYSDKDLYYSGYDDSNMALGGGQVSLDYGGDVTDIVRGLKETRDESQYNVDVRNPAEMKRVMDRDVSEQARKKTAYETQDEGWWLGKLLGRNNPNAGIKLKDNRYYEKGDRGYYED